MALVKKTSQVRNSVARNNPTPEEMLPPLPEKVLERFPEMEAWQLAYESKFAELRDALERRQEATDDEIAELKRRVTALEP